jgi:putative ABC transport system ATP-binding protein
MYVCEVCECHPAQLGFIFQSYNLINRTTVLKNVEFPGIIGGMSDGYRRHRALNLLDFLGIKKQG